MRCAEFIGGWPSPQAGSRSDKKSLPYLSNKKKRTIQEVFLAPSAPATKGRATHELLKSCARLRLSNRLYAITFNSSGNNCFFRLNTPGKSNVLSSRRV